MMAEPLTNGHTNGQSDRFIDSIDPDDPEREKELMKSVKVREDLKGMEGRKRVSEILNSQAFRDELEEMVESQPDDSGLAAACLSLRTGPHPASLAALQQISQLILPNTSSVNGALVGATLVRSQSEEQVNDLVLTLGFMDWASADGEGSGTIIPIADVKGINASVYSKGERLLRCKLASVYRLMDLHGWTSGIYNHITVRESQEKEHFLINPFGLLFHEMTAGSLLKIDMQCNILDKGNTSLGVNKAGFILHAAIHAARPDLKCIIHAHIPAVVAVSSMKCGLLPISQEAMLLGPVSYHDFAGLLVDDAEKEELGRDLGPTNKIMLLRNHGFIVCAPTIEEAFFLTQLLVYACESQVKMIPIGLENLVLPSEEAQRRTFACGNSSSVNVGAGRKWKPGELEFEALMRYLDAAGYRTGYIYKQSALKIERTDRLTSDVEYPASTSLLAFYDDAGELTSPVKAAQERNKQHQKTKWLNTPNTYKREEVDEIGTDNPKKITKWVPDKDSDNCQGTPVKVVNPNQFAPQGENPKEFLQQQRQIKDGYYTDKISAGPQSKVLEGGMTEGQILEVNQSSNGDHIMVVGAASKGIIKREHQHNAVVYKSHYTTNPFDKMTDDELAVYQEAVKNGEKPTQEEVLEALAQQEAQEEIVTEEVDAPVEKVPEKPKRKQETSLDDLHMPDEPSLKTQSTPALNEASPDQSAPFHQQTPSAHSAYTPTKSPSSQKRSYYTPRTAAMRRAQSKETNIDDILNSELSRSHTETPQPAIRRGVDHYSSMRAPIKSAEIVEDDSNPSNFQRSKSERRPKKGEREQPVSAEVGQNGGDSHGNDSDTAAKDRKKKDKKNRMPSFSFGKKKDTKKSRTQTAV